MKATPCSLAGLFRQHALRGTRQREMIYRALAASKSHPSAEDLYRSAKQLDPGLSLATVYNTLEAFTSCGLARKLAPPDGAGPCRYDADMAAHVHVVLPSGEIYDVPHEIGDQLLKSIPPELVREIEQHSGARISRLTIQIHTAACE